MYVRKLLQSARHIRLLRVSTSTSTLARELLGSQSKSSDQEHYELIHIPLATHRNVYPAVSYTWGDPSQDSGMEKLL